MVGAKVHEDKAVLMPAWGDSVAVSYVGPDNIKGMIGGVPFAPTLAMLLVHELTNGE